MNEYAIRISNLSKDYKIYKKNGQRAQAIFFGKDRGIVKNALSDINLDIKKGEKVAFIGNVGSGRTTLMKIASEMAFPTSGELHIDGEITVVLDLRAGFDFELTGRENIYMKGGMLGWTQREIKEREQKIIDFAEMESVIDHPMKSYTAGMASRLGFAMQMFLNPEILVFDSALNLGDREYKEKMISRLAEFAVDESITMLIVSNSAPLIKRICSRAIVMDDGYIKFDGTPEEAMAYYKLNVKKNAKKNDVIEDFDSDKDEEVFDDAEFDF